MLPPLQCILHLHFAAERSRFSWAFLLDSRLSAPPSDTIWNSPLSFPIAEQSQQPSLHLGKGCSSSPPRKASKLLGAPLRGASPQRQADKWPLRNRAKVLHNQQCHHPHKDFTFFFLTKWGQFSRNDTELRTILKAAWIRLLAGTGPIDKHPSRGQGKLGERRHLHGAAPTPNTQKAPRTIPGDISR